MRQVEIKQVYVMDGEKFDNMDKVRDHCENKAEKFIRHLLQVSEVSLDAKYSNQNHLIELMLDDNIRKNLIEVLSYDLTIPNDDD